MLIRVFLLVSLSISALSGSLYAQSEDGCEDLPAEANCDLLSDFEADTPREPPQHWKGTEDKELVPLSQKLTSHRNVYVRAEDGNQFARVHTKRKAFRVVRSKKQDLEWNLQKRPYLRWSWRAKALPEGANEKKDATNDTGGAVYVTFKKNWLGFPKSIKYTYSSTLPVGTTVDYGVLKVLVVASKAEQGLDQWITHERNVVEDYKRLHGGTPPGTPLAVTMWSDSDTVGEVGTIDFDDFLFLSQSGSDDVATSSPQ